MLSENTVQSLGSFVGGLLLTVLLAWLAIADRVPVVSAKNTLQGCALLSSVKQMKRSIVGKLVGVICTSIHTNAGQQRGY